MSPYLKFIMVAALFVTTTINSMFETAPTSASATPSQTTLKDVARKASKPTESASTSATEVPVEQATSSSSVAAAAATTNDPTPTATDASVISSTVAKEETVDSFEKETPYEAVEEEVQTTGETISATEKPVAEVATSVPTSIQSDQMKINDQLISYSNAGKASGQAVIDANPNQVATWGGAAVQSGTDEANTHFIGHNPGIFNVLFSVGVGDRIEVSDGSNQITDYTVTQIVTVDDSGMAAAGTDYWEQITGTGGGERMTLQTCINDDYNLIIFASK
ncbi:sortase [Enterococcus pseudoavium]|nr:sortase [Enterococcus pseudoavium]